MHSELPKPLHRLCGRPMVLHVLDALSELAIDEVAVVVGFRSNEVTKIIESEAPSGLRLHFVEQHQRRGTGDATAVGLTAFADPGGIDEGEVLVVPGDAPLVRSATLARLIELHRLERAGATLLSAVMDDPTGYGRVIRSKSGAVTHIAEQKDATEDELDIREVATSIYCFDRALLAPGLRRLSPSNAQQEYYLTDVISVLDEAGYAIASFVVDDAREVAGVNDRAQLAAAEMTMRGRIAMAWMRKGVTMLNPTSVVIDVSVQLAEEVMLYPNVVLEGTTIIERGVTVGPGSHLVDTTVGIHSSLLGVTATGAKIGANAQVGPYAVLVRGTIIADGEATGPFFSTTSGD